MLSRWFFYLTRPLLLGEAPPLPRPPLLRRGLQPVNRLVCTRKQALTALIFGCARQSIQASLMLCSRWHKNSLLKGLLVIIYATELRLFYATELRLFYAIELRLSMRRGRGCAWFFRPQRGGIDHRLAQISTD